MSKAKFRRTTRKGFLNNLKNLLIYTSKKWGLQLPRGLVLMNFGELHVVFFTKQICLLVSFLKILTFLTQLAFYLVLLQELI